MKKYIAIGCLLVFLSFVACNNGNNKVAQDGKSERQKVSLSGAGATFPLPFYTLALQKYQEKTGNQVSYGGIGSGGGIRSLKDQTVDFAGSDAFLKDEEMTQIKPVIHIPTCMGAVVVAFNLDGINQIKLTGDIIADIFLGKITHWNHSKISSLNPGIKLPNTKIIPVYRSDGSGTTNIFTDYLTKISSAWASKCGAGKTVNFPAGLAAKGNPGVAGAILKTKGAIGYVGSEYAFAQGIKFAAVQNTNGEFVSPDAASISVAAGDIPEDTRAMITNSATPGAYPISCLTWIVVYKDQNYANHTIDQAKALTDMLRFILSDEIQAMTKTVHYAPLPQIIRDKALRLIENINFNGQKLSD